MQELSPSYGIIKNPTALGLVQDRAVGPGTE